MGDALKRYFGDRVVKEIYWLGLLVLLAPKVDGWEWTMLLVVQGVLIALSEYAAYLQRKQAREFQEFMDRNIPKPAKEVRRTPW